MQSLRLVEPLVALFDALVITACVVLACAAVVHTLPPEWVADSTPVQASFDVAVPLPQEADTGLGMTASLY